MAESEIGIFLLHGGVFRKVDNVLKYEGGIVDFIPEVDLDTLNYFKVENYVKQYLKYGGVKQLWYRLPSKTMDKLHAIDTNAGVLRMVNESRDVGFVYMYVEHTIETAVLVDEPVDEPVYEPVYEPIIINDENEMSHDEIDIEMSHPEPEPEISQAEPEIRQTEETHNNETGPEMSKDDDQMAEEAEDDPFFDWDEAEAEAVMAQYEAEKSTHEAQKTNVDAEKTNVGAEKTSVDAEKTNVGAEKTNVGDEKTNDETVDVDIATVYPYEVEDEGCNVEPCLSEDDLIDSDDELVQIRVANLNVRKKSTKYKGIDPIRIPQQDTPQIPDPVDPTPTPEDEHIHDMSSDSSGDSSDEEVDDNIFHGEMETLSKKKGFKYPIFNPSTDMKEPVLRLGLQFETKQIFKAAVIKYGLNNRYDIKWIRNERLRMSGVCMNSAVCPWRVWAGFNQNQFWQITSFNPVHKCGMAFRNRHLSSKFLAHHYFETFRRNPAYKLSDMQADVLKEFEVEISECMCSRARKKALQYLDGSMTEHYAKLCSYKDELEKRNPGSTIIIEHVSPIPLKGLFFRRMYVCFEPVRTAFMETCRPMLGIDGAFLKGLQKGEILSAIAKDGNNQMYPVAWAVVQVENKDNWSWFLKNLIEDLDMRDGFEWTIITDQQKGLLPAITSLLPNAEHRMCARHIYSNWRKKYKGGEYRRCFWSIAMACTMVKFKAEFEVLKSLDSQAAVDLVKTDPIHWSKAFFDTSSKVDNVENNVAEAFNGSIVAARTRPLIYMLEEIRLATMVRIQKRKEWISKYSHSICPRIRKRMEKNKEDVKHWAVVFNGGDQFEVKHVKDSFGVNIKTRSCHCREWDLSGIPCTHAMAAIYKIGGDPEDYVSNWYKNETFASTYSHLLEPITGENQWPESSEQPLQPPPNKKMPGRPKKCRIKNPDEEKKKKSTQDPNILSKKGKQMTCRFCKEKGHNSRSCKQAREAAAARGEPEVPKKPKQKTATVEPRPPKVYSKSRSKRKIVD